MPLTMISSPSPSFLKDDPSSPKLIPNLLPKLAARTLRDVALVEDDYKADFQMADKFESFSAELLRLSLLSITGYGYLIANICMKDGQRTPFFESLLNNKLPLVIGVCALSISATAALYHRYLSGTCLSYQVQILRHLKRAQSGNWNESEQQDNNSELDKIRYHQRKVIRKSFYCIVTASIFLAVGATSAVYFFASTLF